MRPGRMDGVACAANWQRRFGGGPRGAGADRRPAEAGLLVEEALQGTEIKSGERGQAEVLPSYRWQNHRMTSQPLDVESLSSRWCGARLPSAEAVATRDGTRPAEADAQRLALEGELIALSAAIGPLPKQAYRPMPFA